MTDTKPIVSQLVPAYCSPSKDPATAGRVRSAFVAHTMFFHEAGQQNVQLDRLAASTISDADAIVSLLCESYSRAVFETLFAMHFDQADPRADEQLADAISGVYGDEIMQRVLTEVGTRGIIIARV